MSKYNRQIFLLGEKITYDIRKSEFKITGHPISVLARKYLTYQLLNEKYKELSRRFNIMI